MHAREAAEKPENRLLTCAVRRQLLIPSTDAEPRAPASGSRRPRVLNRARTLDDLRVRLEALKKSINALARALRVPVSHVSGIVNEKRGISARMSLRLARYFGTSPELWLGLQQDYELDLAKDTAARQTEREVLPRAS